MSEPHSPSSADSEVQIPLSTDMVLTAAREVQTHLNGLNKPYSAGIVGDCIVEIERLRDRITDDAQPSGLRECLQSIADADDGEPREPDDADWRFRFLEAKRAARCALAAHPGPSAGKGDEIVAELRDLKPDTPVLTILDRCIRAADFIERSSTQPQTSAGNGGAPRDWFGDLNERVGKGLNAPLEPSAGQAEAIPEGFVSVELLQIARATADRLREENANLRASNKSIFAAMDVSEDRLRSVEDLRMGDVAMEFRRLRETLLIPEPQSACRFDQDGQTCPTCGRVGNGEG